jgi:hypothetical protein
MISLREIAVALGGEVCAGQVLAPGPGHSRRDRSLSVRLSASAPDGFLAFSHAGDDWRDCRDYVRGRLGLTRDTAPHSAQECRGQAPPPAPADVAADAERVAHALALWRAAVEPRGTIAERYLNSRGLALDASVAGRVLRWHAGVGALVALFRNIATAAPQAVSRTFLTPTGEKLTRKFAGPVGGAAIMLDGFADVTMGLHIGEGIETCMSARVLGMRPTWVLGSKGAIGAFPVLGGVEALTIFEEPDALAEVEACADRWSAVGREVYRTRAIGGKDLNDVLRGAA